MDNINIDITDNGDNVVVTISQGITTVWADQITITGTGTFGDPLVGIAGAADMLKATYDPTNVNADAFDYNNFLNTPTIPTALSQLYEDVNHRVVTDAEKLTWNSLIGGSIFQTTWNANTNTPTLTSSSGTKGYYYIVTVDGSTNLDGITDWEIGDWAIFDGTVWRKVDNTDSVSSVNNLTGAVNLDTSNVPSVLNSRYVTDADLTTLANVGTNLDAKTNKLISANRQIASYVLALSDADKLVEMNVGSANNLQVPLNSTVAFPIGTQILISQYGAGQTTVTLEGGVTLRSAESKVKLNKQYSGATLIKIATDEWYLFGDIV